MPYGLSSMYGGGGGYSSGTQIPMDYQPFNYALGMQQYQNLAQSQQNMRLQGQQAANANAMAQQTIQSGAMDLDQKKADQQRANDFSNMISQFNTSTPVTQATPQAQTPAQPVPAGAPMGSGTPGSTPYTPPASTNQPNPSNPNVSPNPSVPPETSLGAMPGQNGAVKSLLPPTAGTTLADHPAITGFMSRTPNMSPDTSNALDSEFASKHIFTSVDPKTGQQVTNTFDRQGLVDSMMAYTDHNGNHTMAADANKLMAQWTLTDAQDEKAKADAVVAQNADILGKASALSYLTPAQQKLTYGALKAQAGNPSDWPADISSPQGQAWLADQQEQARQNAATATTASKRAEDASKAMLDKAAATGDYAKAAITPSEIGKNNAEAYKAYADAAKAKQEIANGMPNSGLVGPDYLNTLSPAAQGYLKGVATGQVPINTRTGGPVLQAAHQAFPDTDISAAQKFSKDLGAVTAGTSGGVQVGANKSLEHLYTMIAADSGKSSGLGLNIGPNWLDKAVNSTYNIVASPNQEAVWNSSHAALVNEMSRAFKGGPPTDSEVVRDVKNLSYSDSPDRKAAVYKNYADLLNGQVNGVENQRRQSYGSADPGTSLLSPKALSVLSKVNGGTLPAGTLPPAASGQQTAAVPAGQPQGQPQGQNVAPMGTVVKMPDGSTRTKTAQGWR